MLERTSTYHNWVESSSAVVRLFRDLHIRRCILFSVCLSNLCHWSWSRSRSHFSCHWHSFHHVTPSCVCHWEHSFPQVVDLLCLLRLQVLQLKLLITAPFHTIYLIVESVHVIEQSSSPCLSGEQQIKFGGVSQVLVPVVEFVDRAVKMLHFFFQIHHVDEVWHLLETWHLQERRYICYFYRRKVLGIRADFGQTWRNSKFYFFARSVAKLVSLNFDNWRQFWLEIYESLQVDRCQGVLGIEAFEDHDSSIWSLSVDLFQIYYCIPGLSTVICESYASWKQNFLFVSDFDGKRSSLRFKKVLVGLDNHLDSFILIWIHISRLDEGSGFKPIGH